ncbi:hypothetical protein HJB56_26245 [Rhizobium lentis]|uniref:hypothetical protein n=1 Tax=Rhizobium lentis TaxID=1138194 RepID=UPI001C83E865|nr:hypothetical protein [Rhizobium lentis]MBX5086231.1 hypothetical protein [Rhizobium lentis]MBX5096343.1 hypothetical protein [Rhizobium lentis]MBX5123511.1 hypothetical protein [Rhizobium lentis]
MLELFSALMSDYMSSNNIPLDATVSTAGVIALRALLKKRAQNARDILLEEIRLGNRAITFKSADEAAAIIYRYMRAGEEGAARTNLRLLARVIVGSAEGPGLYADDFLRWADILAGLRREEVIVLGVMQRLNDQPPNPEHAENPAFFFWEQCQAILNAEYLIEEHVSLAYTNALLRTGLIQLVSGSMKTPMVPLPTFALRDLSAILSVEGILRSEQGAVAV